MPITNDHSPAATIHFFIIISTEHPSTSSVKSLRSIYASGREMNRVALFTPWLTLLTSMSMSTSSLLQICLSRYPRDTAAIKLVHQLSMKTSESSVVIVQHETEARSQHFLVSFHRFTGEPGCSLLDFVWFRARSL